MISKTNICFLFVCCFFLYSFKCSYHTESKYGNKNSNCDLLSNVRISVLYLSSVLNIMPEKGLKLTNSSSFTFSFQMCAGLSLSEKCTPNQNWAHFMPYLKNINTVLKNIIKGIKDLEANYLRNSKRHQHFSRPRGFWVTDNNTLHF